MKRAFVLGVAGLLLAASGSAALAQAASGGAGQPAAQPGQPVRPGGGAGGEGRGGGPGGGGGGGGGGRFLERLMQNDANADGMLQYDEVPEQLRDRFFADADTNSDKVLDKAEIEAMRTRFAERAAGAGQGRGPGGEGGPRAGGFARAGEMSVHDAMEQAGRSMRGLSRSQFTAESREADLRSVQGLQQALLAAKAGTANVEWSEPAKKKYGTDKAAFERDFRSTLIDALIESLTLEIAVTQGNAEEAKKAVERIDALEHEAHEVFQPEEKEEKEGEAPKAVAPAAPK